MFDWLCEKVNQREAKRREENQRIAASALHRLLSPDFDMIRRRFGKPISHELRQLYSSDEILKENVLKQPPGSRRGEGIGISWYIPMDEEALGEQWHKDDGYLDFANDGTGGCYTVDPTDNDAVIHYYHHEDGSIGSTGVKLRDLMSLIESDPR